VVWFSATHDLGCVQRFSILCNKSAVFHKLRLTISKVRVVECLNLATRRQVMRRSKEVVVLLSVLLAISAGGCSGCDKKPPEGSEKEELAEEPEDDRSEVMQELEKKGERARIGEAVDFDGDGHKEYRQWTDEKGVRHIEVKGPPRSPFLYTSETQPDGTEVILYDADGDGIIDKRTEKKPSSLIHFFDRDGDGVFEERVTNTFDYKNNKNHRVFEKRNSDGNWEKTLEKTEPINRGTPFPPEMKVVPGSKVAPTPQKTENLPPSFVEPPSATTRAGSYRNIGNALRIKRTGAGTCNSSQRSAVKPTIAGWLCVTAASKAIVHV